MLAHLERVFKEVAHLLAHFLGSKGKIYLTKTFQWLNFAAVCSLSLLFTRGVHSYVFFLLQATMSMSSSSESIEVDMVEDRGEESETQVFTHSATSVRKSSTAGRNNVSTNITAEQRVRKKNSSAHFYAS